MKAEKTNTENRYIHLLLGSKGGVGKTYNTKNLCEYHKFKKIKHTVVDTDCSNKSLVLSKFFKAIPFQLKDADNLPSTEKLPLLINSYSDVYNLIVDTGSNTFQPWYLFLKDNSGREICEAYGFKLVVHVVVVPGQMFQECIFCIESLCEADPGLTIAVWLNNGYNSKTQPITTDDFKATPIFAKYSHIIKHIIELPTCDPIRRKLTELIANNYLSMTEIAEASPEQLYEIQLGDRCASMADKIIITNYRKLIFSAIDEALAPLYRNY